MWETLTIVEDAAPDSEYQTALRNEYEPYALFLVPVPGSAGLINSPGKLSLVHVVGLRRWVNDRTEIG